ncbi:sigma-70 family RNA polymerase sigma factor [Puniceicoccales bacterium CK1056]|uniref:Sigma-70 family RNA polymerase sigma factor n=1 Tax=Oceanipulchritudo coccoides TaxID=2706888 RepID=A0A6B2M5A6_9BACT|nr:sigma-70 family RNA polymerase sigma factor [Oceanipulchritudo coccoides]NDV63576.1 sigma-70 family RNA polymerase sigma factor [Oceanipulchritudo coccoides]
MKHEPQNPDSEWMHSIVEAHAADLTRYAASILFDTDAAKDVVQDVFLRLWKEPRERIADHVRPWLFRACRNRALDIRRKGGRMKPLDESHTAQAVAEGPGPAAMAEQNDRHHQLLHLIRHLPDNQQEVVRLKFQNGMSYKEIATVTELSVTNVGFLLHTAIQTLRARVGAIGE